MKAHTHTHTLRQHTKHGTRNLKHEAHEAQVTEGTKYVYTWAFLWF